eukprot:8005961-Pyramimonas_sp.AAC.1
MLTEFLTERDWLPLRSPELSETAKLTVLALRMCKLGMTCPGNELLKYGGAIVLACSHPPGTEHDGNRRKK